MKHKDNDWRSEKRKTGGGIKTINGYLYARIQYIDEKTGKRKEKLRRADNRTHARSLIQEMRHELNQSGQETLEKDKMTFNEIADLYEKTKLCPPIFRDGIKVSGLRSYNNQRYLLKSLRQHFHNKIVRNIKPGDLEAYKNTRLNTPVIIKKKIKKANPKIKKDRRKWIYETIEVERPRAIASVNRELSLLRQIFSFAVSQDYIMTNPFSKVKSLISHAAENQRERLISETEESQILMACEIKSRVHIRPIFISALDTAMRTGELLKLKWNDIDLTNKKITVLATNTKTEKERIVGMTPRVKTEMTSLWEKSPKDKDALVFGIKNNFRRSWMSALKEAGLDTADIQFHDTRHTAITNMILAGIPASQVMKISGHTNPKTFQRYVNLTNDSVVQSASLLEDFKSARKKQFSRLEVSELMN